MWKYIVYWTLATTYQIDCPDRETVDEFGAFKNYTMTCSVLHTNTDYESKDRVFVHRDSAMAFYERAKKRANDDQSSWILGTVMGNVELDSVPKFKTD